MSLPMSRMLILVAGLMALTSCSVAQAPSPSPSICDGIDAQLGGCREDLPEFQAVSCQGIAEEFGTYRMWRP